MTGTPTLRATRIERPAQRTETCFINSCTIVHGGPQIGNVADRGWACVDCIVEHNRRNDTLELWR